MSGHPSYTPIRELGRGTYGIVTLCSVARTGQTSDSQSSDNPSNKLDLASSNLVAIKRIQSVVTSYPTETLRLQALEKAKTTGVSVSALREVKILRELRQQQLASPPAEGSQHVLPLLDVFVPTTVPTISSDKSDKSQSIQSNDLQSNDLQSNLSSDISLVLEVCPSDLEKVLAASNPSPVTASHVKHFLHSLLTGVAFIHSQNILHRDLKPDNLLFNSFGVMRIGDFGLSRTRADPGKPMSPEAVTSWYKPPEMLLGEYLYSSAVDVWSVGCIFAEMLRRKPFLPGNGTDNSQLAVIFTTFGPPTKDNWPSHDLLPNVVRGVKWGGGLSVKPPPLLTLFPAAPQHAVDLLEKLMYLDPSKRLTAEIALKHPYFQSEPGMGRTEDLPIPGVKLK